MTLTAPDLLLRGSTPDIGEEARAARTELTFVDLFAGCGGLSLGVHQACEEIGISPRPLLAVDMEALATSVYSDNFPLAPVQTVAVEVLFDGEVGSAVSQSETQVRSDIGAPVDLLIAGPPCQGHSNLNNHTRGDDPKNLLYERVVRATEVLQPRVLLIENVPAILNDRRLVVDNARKHLESIGYVVADRVIRVQPLGVSQERKRHLLLATSVPGIDVEAALRALSEMPSRPEVNLRTAIGDLQGIEASSVFDTPSSPSSANLERMNWLLENEAFDLPNVLRPPCHQGEHSYKSMYGRLDWDKPAQTITSGFGSMGQGRYVHPGEPRTLTPHEAARIQGFPDSFDFSKVVSRGKLATMIGNAVPPALSKHLLHLLLPTLIEADARSSIVANLSSIRALPLTA